MSLALSRPAMALSTADRTKLVAAIPRAIKGTSAAVVVRRSTLTAIVRHGIELGESNRPSLFLNDIYFYVLGPRTVIVSARIHVNHALASLQAEGLITMHDVATGQLATANTDCFDAFFESPTNHADTIWPALPTTLSPSSGEVLRPSPTSFNNIVKVEHPDAKVMVCQITTVEAADHAIEDLMGSTIVSLSCEGNLTREGPLVRVMLARFGGPVYTFELLDMAFNIKDPVLDRIEQVLASDKIVKIVHDVSSLSEAMFYLHHIRIKNIWDTQIAAGMLQHYINIDWLPASKRASRGDVLKLCSMSSLQPTLPWSSAKLVMKMFTAKTVLERRLSSMVGFGVDRVGRLSTYYSEIYFDFSHCMENKSKSWIDVM